MFNVVKRVGESIDIGDGITIRILGVNGTQVRIGIKAPKSVEVHRLEIYERIKAQFAPTPDEVQH